MRKETEHDIQAALFLWAKYNYKRFPMLYYMFAIPNGGDRHILTAVKMKKEGVKAGVPDIMLPFPMGQYHGLFIEMKRKGGQVSVLQKEWLMYLASAGYKVAVSKSLESAILEIENYLLSR